MRNRRPKKSSNGSSTAGASTRLVAVMLTTDGTTAWTSRVYSESIASSRWTSL